jgi:hypothetical protein
LTIWQTLFERAALAACHKFVDGCID